MWKCSLCEFEENAAEDATCVSCDEGQRPAPAQDAPSIIIARVSAVAPVPGKDRLKQATLDVGSAAGGSICVVTNATVHEGTLVAVALPGAVVRSGGDEVTVKAAPVGGIMSGGMLVDCPMLGWKGGAAGCAATVPEACGLQPGDAAPAARPRGDA